MNRQSHSFISATPRVACGIALGAVLCISGVQADDTEIFFGQVSASVTTNPNVLFVLDTSGSMTNRDGTAYTRLERMKQALDRIIDQTNNVNVGIMRFNGANGGASVIYPITPINGSICDAGNCPDIQVNSEISEAADDTEQRVVNNAMLPGGSILSMSNWGGNQQQVGLRFQNLNIPQGAVITSANLEFAAHQGSSGTSALTIAAEDVDDAPVFGNAASTLSGKVTGPAVIWSPGNWTTHESYETVDISAALQPVIDRTGWCGGNSLALLVRGTGVVHGVSFEQSQFNSALSPPKLRVTYDPTSIPASGGCREEEVVLQISSSKDDGEQRVSNGDVSFYSSDLELPRDGSNDQYIGMRFVDVPVPQGATVSSAWLEFQIDEYKTGTVNLEINTEASDDAPEFADWDWGIHGNHRPFTATTVPWNNLPELPEDDKLISPDIATLIQEVVNRSGWSAGNALAVKIKGTGGSNKRTVESYNGDSSVAPRLYLKYRVASGNSNAQVSYSVRDAMHQTVFEIDHAGGTPIVDSYYEAAQYMLGGDVDYGKTRGASDRLKPENRVSHVDSWTGSGNVVYPTGCTDDNAGASVCRDQHISGAATYQTPMNSSCQSNHIVLLTDGQASYNSAVSRVQTLIAPTTCAGSGNERCGRELAEWLYDTDHRSIVPSIQNVRTHTIAFNLDNGYGKGFMDDIAMKGGGSSHEADSADELVDVFEQILGSVVSVDTSFVAPGATVNQFNRLTHRNDIYFALFKPEERPRWSGNLKRYKVGEHAGEIRIEDFEGNNAVDDETGFFDEDAKSWWSTMVDGSTVSEGGASEQLSLRSGTIGERRLFTYTGDSSTLTGNSSVAALNQSNHALHENNSAITNDMLGIGQLSGSVATQTREEILQWGRGVDLLDEDEDNDATDYRAHMGDPMHSRPVILNYADGGNVQTLVMIATNEGFLHAIDRSEGEEIFAFMPPELLQNIHLYKKNQSADRHPYGLDGSISVWTEDSNNNVTIDAGEEAFLYIGMRRGGSNYYALDVSDADDPKLAWIIRGGPGGTPGFEELGQSWSKPAPATIMFQGVERHVVIFGAGYDENQDPQRDGSGNVQTRTTDSIGRGFYVVDARTGERLFAALNPAAGGVESGDLTSFNRGMDYSIPSDLRVIDVNFDGLADQIWLSDTGGRIWRFDFTPQHQSGALMRGGVMAEFGNNASLADNRRFYYEPDVAVVGDEGKRFLSVSIGSGWRAHPLNTDVQDRMYMIRSYDIYSAPEHYGGAFSSGTSTTYRPIVDADLTDVTNDLTATVSNRGWYFDLPATGEKILGDSITVNNQIVFTSYLPVPDLDECATAIGAGSVYVVNVINGAPTIDNDGDGDIDLEDRSIMLSHGGIPPEPAALITENGPTILVGPEQPVDVEFDNLTKRTFWRQNRQDLTQSVTVSEQED